MSTPTRNLTALGSEIFDVLVIGGGIHGAAMAWEAVTRGLKTALIDRGDFGAATTAGNFKTIHGGLRYMQHLDLPRLLESASEQQMWRRVAPHLVAPLPFLVPCYGLGMKSRTALALGATIYEALTFWRNQGITPELRLPDHSVLSKSDCLERAPGLRADGLRGGVIFYDSLMRSPERLTLSFHLSARARGAQAWNYVELIGFRTVELGEGKEISAAVVRDCIGGSEFEVRARHYLNVTGPWNEKVQRLATGEGADYAPVFSKGVQVVLPRIVDSCAVAIDSQYRDEAAQVSRGARSYFLIPWRDSSILGTADILHTADPNDYRITEAEVARFIDEVSKWYRSDKLKLEHVRLAFGGLRPISPELRERVRAAGDRFGTVDVARRDLVHDHRTDRGARHLRNLISVEGIKYTTTRHLAERVLNHLVASRNLAAGRSITSKTPLLGGDFARMRDLRNLAEAAFRGMNEGVIVHIAEEYGTELVKIRDLALSAPALKERIAPDYPHLTAEIVHAVRSECAMTLEDVIFRRTSFGSGGSPGSEVLKNVAGVMALELDWSEAHRRREVERVEGMFPGTM